MSAAQPLFSIVVPTLNRPRLLRQALASIDAQGCRDFEVLVVDDGSRAECLQEMRELAGSVDRHIVFLWRAPDDASHGPGVARNHGIDQARGRFIGFLDDDDHWCDPRHLERARASIESLRPDMYVANQASRRGDEVLVSRWLPHLDRVAAKTGGAEVCEVRRKDLLQREGIGFAHVNMCLYATELVRAVGGFYSLAAYEEDLNFFLRIIDRVQRIAYCSETVSVNSVRATDDYAGLSSIGAESKKLYRMLACQHALLHIESPEVRAYARTLLADTLKSLAKANYQADRYHAAAGFASQAAGLNPTLKWLGIAAYLALQGRLRGNR